MDTGKLLKIIEDIQTDEKGFNFQGHLQNVVNFFNEGNMDGVTQEIKILEDLMHKSSLIEYPASDYKALKEMKIDSFFGPSFLGKLDQILSSRTNEVGKKLETFKNERQDSLTFIEEIKKSLQHFEIFKPYTLEDDNYEIGLTLPDEYRDPDKFNTAFNDVKNLIVNVADATDKSKKIKINSVSNGCIEMFMGVDVSLAMVFFNVINTIVAIYELIKMSYEISGHIENYTDENKEKIEEIRNSEKTRQTEELIDKLMDDLKVKKAAKTTIRLHFLSVLEHAEKGVNLEIRTPELKEPDPPADDGNEEIKKEYEQKKQLYNLKKEIDEGNTKILVLQQNNFYGYDTKFLNKAVKQEENSSLIEDSSQEIAD